MKKRNVKRNQFSDDSDDGFTPELRPPVNQTEIDRALKEEKKAFK